MTYNILMFTALLTTALALGGALAHAFALPNKIGLSVEEYFIAQKAYRGWDRFAYVLVVELIALVALSFLSRSAPYVLWPVLGALASLLAAQAVFWTFTYPANVATDNWTVVPDNWEVLRKQWEFSHAVGAGFQLLAMIGLILATLARARI